VKILFINQFFWPDSSATSQQLTDLALGLTQRGHVISILCSDGEYAEVTADKPPPVTIYRVPALPFVRGRIGRVFSYLSFYVFALLRGLTLPRQDVVVTMTTPPLISLLGTAVKMLRGSRHYSWEQDLYPDVAVDLNYINSGALVDRVAGFFVDLSRDRADGIIALGECMKQRLVNRGVPDQKITIAEHWASSLLIKPMPRPGDPNELVLLYSGNLGLAHDLYTLGNAMRLLRDDLRFHLLFVGGGALRQEFADFCTSNLLPSVEFRPYVARELLSEGLAAGDIGVVTQRESCFGSVVPSKVYGILAAGRPVLFIGPRDATPACIIKRHKCGWQIDCGDESSLAELLRFLAENPHLVRDAGTRARQALLDHYDLPQSIDHIANILNPDPHPHARTETMKPLGFDRSGTTSEYRART
jgi:colanic acid biosynthesis glycosyl transferase WcaI